MIQKPARAVLKERQPEPKQWTGISAANEHNFSTASPTLLRPAAPVAAAAPVLAKVEAPVLLPSAQIKAGCAWFGAQPPPLSTSRLAPALICY